MTPIDKGLSNELKRNYENLKFDKSRPLFISSYQDYKLNEELEKRYLEAEYFNYKLDLTIYALVLISSLIFILYSIYNYIYMNGYSRFSPIESVIRIIEVLFVFGYIAFLSSFFIKRKKRKFRLFLIKETERRNSCEEK